MVANLRCCCNTYFNSIVTWWTESK